MIHLSGFAITSEGQYSYFYVKDPGRIYREIHRMCRACAPEPLSLQSIVDSQGVTSGQRRMVFGLYLGQSLINIPKTQIVRSAGRGLSNEPTPEVQLARVPEL